MVNNSIVVVLDCDGVITSGHFWYNKNEKYLKCFGPDDFDLIKELSKYVVVHFITADKRGFSIIQTRIEKEMKLKLDIVSNKPAQRWGWIKKKYPTQRIVFIGDGWGDFYSLKKASFGITTCDALDHVKESADFVLSRSGGNRAVAEACILIFKKYNLSELIWEIL